MDLVRSQSGASSALASGIHALPGVSQAFAATQGAYRFFNNPRVTLADLAAPLIELAQQEASRLCGDFALVVHDWSQLMFPDHDAKTDRVPLSSRRRPEGYEILTSLLVSDRDGTPIAPLEIGLRAADGVHESRSAAPRPPLSPLDELAPAMRHLDGLSIGKPLVHVIDAEADSVFHYRDWAAGGHLFLVRADDRLVLHEGVEKKVSTIRAERREQGAFRDVRPVRYRSHKLDCRQWVTEVEVALTRPAQRHRPGTGDRQRIPGVSLPLRLVIAEVRAADGRCLATWNLLTNVPAHVPAETIALWYYWRWNIEQLFKLLKSAGTQIETWQQRSAGSIARRLWVACMACATAWQIHSSPAPQAEQVRRTLVRLSGRLMKRTVPHTIPALLAGLWNLLAMLEILEQYTPDELRQFARLVNSTSGFV